MKELKTDTNTPIGEGRWRVENRTLDEVILALRAKGTPRSELLVHLERLKWRTENPSPRHRNKQPSKQQTIDDLKAGMAAGVLTCDFNNRWWYDEVRLGLQDDTPAAEG